MTMLLLMAVLAGAADKAATPSPQLDCRAERIALYQAIKPTVDLDATLGTKPDSDPLTVQFLVVPTLTVNEGHVSDDGQVIYLPSAATVGAQADPDIGANLYAQAMDKLLALKVGNVCPPLRVPRSGT